jgi:prepilin-type N-terminal cleavage/methylation domain-containing protein
MKIPVRFRRESGFTLIEMMIVIAIIVVLAALTIGGYNYAMRGSKRRTTEATMTAIQSSLERYFDKFGEFPEPVSADETIEVMPKKSYRIGGAKCLYQALRGDGYDATLGAANSVAGGGGSAASDGNFDDTEIPNILFKDMPNTMWRRINQQHYIIVDGFSRPFQYVKAAPVNTGATGSNGNNNNSQATTINTTYDLWSYGEDEININTRSIETIENEALANKWIKNW